MAPFYVLIGSFILLRTLHYAGVPFLDSWVLSLRIAVALMFVLTASGHWGKRRPDLIRMVPPAFPQPGLIVSITGCLEIAGAVGMLIPTAAPAASTGLTLLLVAMFPANVYAVRKGLTLNGRPVTPLIRRTVLQIIFLTAVILAGWYPSV